MGLLVQTNLFLRDGMVVHRTAGTDKPISQGVWLYIGLLVQTNLFLRDGMVVHRAAGTYIPISQGWYGCT